MKKLLSFSASSAFIYLWRYVFLLPLSDIRPCHISPQTPTFSSCLWITNERERNKLSAHSLRVPPAPTTIIYLLGPNPPSQIFTGCWFHSVTVTIWTLHGGLISCTRPIRKLSGSCVGQSWKPAPEVRSYCQALLTWNDVFI